MKHKKNILLGITGSIAAYKIISLISQLKKSNYDVKCVLTNSATQFITPLTIQTISQNKPFLDIAASNEQYIEHIELTKWADAMIIAPATANFIAKAAHGIADDMLTSLYLAMNFQKSIIVAPAMNKEMWHNQITQSNLSTLKHYQVTILPPTYGEQACGDIGIGRMIEPQEIYSFIDKLFVNNKQNLEGKTILITAGPTIENIDPIRYISNHSSGKMGYAIARAAQSHGAQVILITGPTHIEKPNCTVINVNTAEEMYKATTKYIKESDVFISTAAVSDFRPTQPSSTKIKKESNVSHIELEHNPDILKNIAKTYPNKFYVGFAAETCDLEHNALKKLKEKKLDLIVVNHFTAANSDYNQVTVIDKNKKKTPIPKAPKEAIANNIINIISSILNSQ